MTGDGRTEAGQTQPVWAWADCAAVLLDVVEWTKSLES